MTTNRFATSQTFVELVSDIASGRESSGQRTCSATARRSQNRSNESQVSIFASCRGSHSLTGWSNFSAGRHRECADRSRNWPAWASWLTVDVTLVKSGVIAIVAGISVWNSFRAVPDKTLHSIQGEHLMDHQVADANVQQARTNLKSRLEAFGAPSCRHDRRGRRSCQGHSPYRENSGDWHCGRSAVRLWENVSEGVQHSLDISSFVKTHPWQVFTLAAGTGFFAGSMIRPSSMLHSSKGQMMGIVGDLLGVLRKELMSVGEATIAAGAAAIKQNLSAIPSA